MQDVNHQLFGESVDADVAIGADAGGERQTHITEVLAALNLEDKRERHPMSLSGASANAWPSHRRWCAVVR